MPYACRIIDTQLDELLQQIAAISIEGPKGVGKTATAQRRAKSVFRLDDVTHRQIVAASPAVALEAAPPVLLDEWQNVESIWDTVKRAIDDDEKRTPGRFLLTGSALPQNNPRRHSGAGRIISLRMRPLSLAERDLGPPTISLSALLLGHRPDIGGQSTMTLQNYVAEIVKSGFPGLRHLTGAALRAQLDGYLTRVVDRDFHEQGLPLRRPESLRRWLTAYAAAIATTTSLEKIRNAASANDGEVPGKHTVNAYVGVLERLWLIDEVPGWSPSRNHLTRLVQAPKHHLADCALAARLLGASEAALLDGMASPNPTPRDGTLLGQLFESLVTLSVRVYAQGTGANVRHLRTRDGRQEVDLIVERDDHRVLGMEVKLSPVVTNDDVKHLLWLREQIGDDLVDSVVVTTGQFAYRRPDGIAVIPAALLGP